MISIARLSWVGLSAEIPIGRAVKSANWSPVELLSLFLKIGSNLNRVKSKFL